MITYITVSIFCATCIVGDLDSGRLRDRRSPQSQEWFIYTFNETQNEIAANNVDANNKNEISFISGTNINAQSATEVSDILKEVFGNAESADQDNRGPPPPPPPDHRGPPPDSWRNRDYDNRGPSPDHRGPPPDHRGPPPDRWGTPPDHRGPHPPPPRDHRGPPPDRWGPPPDHRGPPPPPPPDPRGPPPDSWRDRDYDNRGPPPDYRGPPPDHRGPPPDRWGPPPGHRGPPPPPPPPDHRGPPSDHRGPPPDRWGPPSDHRGPQTDNRGPPPPRDRWSNRDDDYRISSQEKVDNDKPDNINKLLEKLIDLQTTKDPNTEVEIIPSINKRMGPSIPFSAIDHNEPSTLPTPKDPLLFQVHPVTPDE